MVKLEADLGNEVATHTWNHYDLTKLPIEEQKKEIINANNLINQITGKHNTLFRPPYGSYNDSLLAQTALTAVNWSIDTNDWRCNSAYPIIDGVNRYIHDGAIILMYDIHPWSVEAVPQIIKNLKQQGYNFVTVSTLIRIQEGKIQPHEVYFGK